MTDAPGAGPGPQIVKQTPVGVPTILNGTDSIRKQIRRQRDMARRYGANLTALQRKHVLEALAEIEQHAREMTAIVGPAGSSS
jgi:hypothetical protein